MTGLHGCGIAFNCSETELSHLYPWFCVSRSVWHILLPVPGLSSRIWHEWVLPLWNLCGHEDPLPDPIRHPCKSLRMAHHSHTCIHLPTAVIPTEATWHRHHCAILYSIPVALDSLVLWLLCMFLSFLLLSACLLKALDNKQLLCLHVHHTMEEESVEPAHEHDPLLVILYRK